MKDILTVFSKELRRFFTDTRTLAALFIPGVLIFVLYSVLGGVISNQVTSMSASPENTTFQVAYTNDFGQNKQPLLIEAIGLYFSEEGKNNVVDQTKVSSSSIETAKEKVVSGELDLLVVFTPDFETNVLYGAGNGENSISLFYNAKDEDSSYIYSLASGLVSTCYNRYLVNIVDGEYQQPNLADGDYMLNEMMSFIFPMITIALLFSTILTICPESIAGEKERGTIASLLLTPVKRSHIALGKILALSVTAIASGFVSFLGIVLSLPQLFGGEMDFLSVFTPGSIVVLFFLIITALFLFVTMGLFVSAFAKTIKEANAYLTPLMIVFMVLAILPSVMDLSGIGIAFVPVLDILVSMNLVITGASASLLIPYVSVTIAMNLVCSAVFVFLVAKIFDSERVMFSR